MVPYFVLNAIFGLACAIIAYKNDKDIKLWTIIGMAGGLISVAILILLCFRYWYISDILKIFILIACIGAIVIDIIFFAMSMSAASAISAGSGITSSGL